MNIIIEMAGDRDMYIMFIEIIAALPTFYNFNLSKRKWSTSNSSLSDIPVKSYAPS